MALNPQDKEALAKFTLVAKKIIYDAGRMRQFMQMLGSKQGALQAVHAVMAIIQKQRPIPATISPLLGVNIYMLMVDIAQQATKHKPDPKIIQAVVAEILSSVQQSNQQEPQPAQQTAPQAAPQGIIASQMQGAAA